MWAGCQSAHRHYFNFACGAARGRDYAGDRVACLWQPDNAPIFVRKPLPTSAKLDGSVRFEQQSLQLLYRNTQEFAVGQNASIHAEPFNGDRTISPCFYPHSFTPFITPNFRLKYEDVQRSTDR